jgi:hypothetical protein
MRCARLQSSFETISACTFEESVSQGREPAASHGAHAIGPVCIPGVPASRAHLSWAKHGQSVVMVAMGKRTRRSNKPMLTAPRCLGLRPVAAQLRAGVLASISKCSISSSSPEKTTAVFRSIPSTLRFIWTSPQGAAVHRRRRR